MRIASRFAFTALCVSTALFTAAPVAAQEFEVWVVDQSNSNGKAYGGAIHIFDGAALNGKPAPGLLPLAKIDLGGATATLCFDRTGINPVRPHMLFFNAAHDHAVLSFVVSGHTVIFDAASRQPLECFRSEAGAGGVRQAHAAVPAPDDTFILVANQNGKLLERIDTNYATATFTQTPAATLNLATCTTPNGVACQLAGVRPDNAPICPLVDSSSALGFVTLRGGGLLVVNPRTNPMVIVAEYDMQTVHGNGCGGSEAAGSMFLASGGGTATNLSEFDVYRFPLAGYSAANPVNTPAPLVVFSDDVDERDAHGTVATKAGRFLWVTDRHHSVIEIFDTATNERQTPLDLKTVSTPDPAPDLMDLAPAGNRMFISLRGPVPLTGDPHVSTGTTPGVMVMRVEAGGRRGDPIGVVRISNVDAAGIERADPHGIRVRRR